MCAQLKWAHIRAQPLGRAERTVHIKTSVREFDSGGEQATSNQQHEKSCCFLVPHLRDLVHASI